MAEKISNGVRAVSELATEMRTAIIELAGDRQLFDTRDRWLDRAARTAGISRRMAKAFFYNETCNPSADVVASVRSARDNLRTKAKEEEDVAVAARSEYSELLARIERLEAALRVQSAEPCGVAIDAVRDMPRRSDRAVG